MSFSAITVCVIHFNEIKFLGQRKYVNEPYVGFYKLMQPAILACDADLVKDILSKDFDCFERSDTNVSKKYDPLMAANPFFLSGDEWKEARKTIVPAFTLSKV